MKRYDKMLLGFNQCGVWRNKVFSRKKKNAEKFVEEIKNNEKVIKIELEEIIATPREYIEIDFSIGFFKDKRALFDFLVYGI